VDATIESHHKPLLAITPKLLLAPASGFGEVAAQPMKTPKKFVNCTAFGAGGHTVLSVAG
jgi:hypothetical protein